jgi:hypothetical protein
MEISLFGFLATIPGLSSLFDFPADFGRRIRK